MVYVLDLSLVFPRISEVIPSNAERNPDSIKGSCKMQYENPNRCFHPLMTANEQQLPMIAFRSGLFCRRDALFTNNGQMLDNEHDHQNENDAEERIPERCRKSQTGRLAYFRRR